MIKPDRFWIVASSDFYDIKKSTEVVCITWNRSIYDDFVFLAESYYECAHMTLTEIVNSGDDNIKCDMWFLPGMYMYRQAIELLCKALIIPCISNKNQLSSIFVQHKHNVESLFTQYKALSENIRLSEDEISWLEKYLANLEIVDRGSDLFRYPFRDDFLSDYSNDFLDVVDMANGFEQCYSILFKCVEEKYNPEKYQADIDCTMSTNFLHFAPHGIGNCQLYESPWGDGFHKQIVGYSNVAEYVFSQTNGLSKMQLLFPVTFLLRNAIELSLKRLLFAKNDFRVSEHLRKAKKNSHLLYKDLWKNVRPMIEYYAKESNEDLSQIGIAETCIQKLSAVDKHGDTFRYPVNYGLQHRFVSQKLDFAHIYGWMQGIFNFLDGCDSMLSAIYDYECEMHSY